MKFVIKSLLFVNLLLQMTGSLRKCFDQDTNLLLTIILLAFSLIGIVGLVISNRFILITFAACMMLVLVASVTIYEIGRTEPDSLKPKVPYYSSAATSGKPRSHPDKGGRPTKAGRLAAANQTGAAPRLKQPMTASSLGEPDYDLGDQQRLAMAKKIAQTTTSTVPTTVSISGQADSDDKSQDEAGGPQAVASDQWLAYERHLYARYLAVVSQSIELVMQTLLASWLALLLDEDSDQCFGSASESRNRSQSRGQSSAKRAAAPSAAWSGSGSGSGPAPPTSTAGRKSGPTICNYNGVRYSIRPDTADSGDFSPTRLALR